MIDALNLFSAMEENGSNALTIMQEKAFTPNMNKTLRTWGPKAASDLIGRSRKTLFDLEDNNAFPGPHINEKSGKKYYTLADINFYRNHFKTRPAKPKNKKACIIGTINYKGGVGKSETSTIFSQYLALKGYKVLDIDLDSQATLTHSFGYNPDQDLTREQTLLPFLTGEATSLHPLIQKTYWDGLDLIPANLALYNAEFVLPARYQNEKSADGSSTFTIHDILLNGLNQIHDDYDVIVMDCPPSMGVLSINALYAADAIVIPSPPSMFDYSSTIQFFGMAKDIFKQLPQKQYAFVKLLVSKYENTQNSNVLVSILRQLFGDQVLLSMMPLSEAIKKTRTEMKSIYEVESYSGAKKTLERVKDAADMVHKEIEDLIIASWANPQKGDS